MSSSSARRRPRALLALAVPLALAAAAPAVDPGLVYEFRVVAEQQDGGRAKETMRMVGRGQVTRAGDARIDLVEARNTGPMADRNGYVLVQGGERMVMVDPKEKQYYAFDVGQMMAGAGAMLQAVGGLVRMEMSDVAIAAEELGAGEAIHGHETRRVRVTQAFTMTMSVLGRRNVTRTVDTTEYWLAPGLKHVVNPYLRVGSAAAGALDFGNPEFAAQMAAAQAALNVGLPLKSVSRGAAIDDKGKATVTVTTMEITSLQEGDVPASAFAIPAGYTEVAMPFEQLQAIGDSSAARPTPGAEGAKAAPARGLRGLLRRP